MDEVQREIKRQRNLRTAGKVAFSVVAVFMLGVGSVALYHKSDSIQDSVKNWASDISGKTELKAEMDAQVAKLAKSKESMAKEITELKTASKTVSTSASTTVDREAVAAVAIKGEQVVSVSTPEVAQVQDKVVFIRDLSGNYYAGTPNNIQVNNYGGSRYPNAFNKNLRGRVDRRWSGYNWSSANKQYLTKTHPDNVMVEKSNGSFSQIPYQQWLPYMENDFNKSRDHQTATLVLQSDKQAFNRKQKELDHLSRENVRLKAKLVNMEGYRAYEYYNADTKIGVQGKRDVYKRSNNTRNTVNKEYNRGISKGMRRTFDHIF